MGQLKEQGYLWLKTWFCHPNWDKLSYLGLSFLVPKGNFCYLSQKSQ